jgi:hypothetical protein
LSKLGWDTPVAVGLGASLAAVLFASGFSSITLAMCNRVFSDVDGKDTTAYFLFLDNIIAWRLAVVLVVAVVCRAVFRSTGAIETYAPACAAALSALLLSHWNQYPVVALFCVLVFFARPLLSLAMLVPAILLASGFVTRGFSAVPFSDVPVNNPLLHVIALSQMAFWLGVFCLAGWFTEKAWKQ